MPWKSRGSRSYFYRSHREGGRVIQDYIGAGPEAELVARWLELEREAREHERWERREEQRSYRELDQAVESACEAVQGVLVATLEAAGFHQHHRGEWRKRRA